MYFKCKTSAEDSHCLLVKGLTPPSSDDYIYLTWQPDFKTEYDIPSGAVSSWNIRLYYVKDENYWYGNRINTLFGLDKSGLRYGPVEAYDVNGNKTTGDIFLEYSSSQVAIRNLMSSTLKVAYVKVKVPETTYYFDVDKKNMTLSSGNSHNLRPENYPAELVYADWSSPWGMSGSGYDPIRVFDLKFFDKDGNEVSFTSSESVYITKDGGYAKLINNSGNDIVASYVKFKFPWPTLA